MARQGLWTDLRLEQISRQLGRLGLSVCPNTVRRLLLEMDYALRANRKSLSGQQPAANCNPNNTHLCVLLEAL